MTLEQCWHRVPGGTAVAAIETARALVAHGHEWDLDLIGVTGRHGSAPTPGYVPPVAVRQLPIGGPLLYESWLRLSWPKVESVADVDVVHATTIIAPATSKPLVVTIHDLAFLHHPQFFTKRGNRVFRRSLDIVADRASVVLCSSMSTYQDCLAAGIDESRLRHVPLGVAPVDVDDDGVARIRETYDLPAEFLLFVGTLEPRKNLQRLVEAIATIHSAPPLVVAGISGWGEALPIGDKVRFLGHVPSQDLAPLYKAATVFCYPSVMEGFGLPILEAMSQSTPVVTSRGTSTEEVAGDAAVLVDPLDVADIARGITTALAARTDLAARGHDRSCELTWESTAERTMNAYRDACTGGTR